ncbi:MAG: NUDIX hydrolase [Patescibacteria group bacterium]
MNSTEEHLIADIPMKALIVQNGKVLVVFDDKWELPGGRLHVGETPEDGLRREVMEELNTTVRILGIHDVFPFTTKSGMHHFCVVFRCELDDPTKPPTPDGEELTDMRWISSPDELQDIKFFPGYRETIEKFFAA